MKKYYNTRKEVLSKAIEKLAYELGITTPEAQEAYAKMSQKKKRKVLQAVSN